MTLEEANKRAKSLAGSILNGKNADVLLLECSAFINDLIKDKRSAWKSTETEPPVMGERVQCYDPYPVTGKHKIFPATFFSSFDGDYFRMDDGTEFSAAETQWQPLPEEPA